MASSSPLVRARADGRGEPGPDSSNEAAWNALAVLAIAGVVVAAGIRSTDSLVPPMAMAVIGVVALPMLARLRRTGFVTLGGIVWIGGLLIFALKWFVRQSPIGPVELHPRFFDRDGALGVFAVFFCAFVLAYLVVARRSPSHDGPRAEPGRAEAGAVGAMVVAAMASLLLVAARYWTARHWSIGVPSVRAVPVRLVLTEDLSISLSAPIYYLTYAGPLAGATYLLAHLGGQRAARRMAVLVLVLFALVGAQIGWRGYSVVALVTWFFARSLRPSARPLTFDRSRRIAVVLIVGLAAALVINLGLSVRSTRDRAGRESVVTFLLRRAGGIDYLAPVVGQVKKDGESRSRVSLSNWDGFVNQRVYRLPRGANAGFAGTGVGWWFAIGGYWAVAGGALVAGALASLIDSRLIAGRGGRFLRLSTVALYIGWFNLFFEGTPRYAVLNGLVIVLVLRILFFIEDVLRGGTQPAPMARVAH